MIDVLYEDNHLLAINKPAGWVTQGAQPGQISALDQAVEYVRKKYNKPGNVYLGVVSRLDRPVSGVWLLARTSKAAARLNDLFSTRDVHKTYWAIVEGRPPSKGRLEHWLTHDDDAKRVFARNSPSPNASHALLDYRVRQSLDEDRSWLEIDLLTGRKHQIRCQLAAMRWPIVGDEKYGAEPARLGGIALHSRRLQLMHPVKQEPLEITAPLPERWKSFGIDTDR